MPNWKKRESYAILENFKMETVLGWRQLRFIILRKNAIESQKCCMNY